MTRSELYALVWQEPMTKLAKRSRLSDVGLRKICTKHGTPTPRKRCFDTLVGQRPRKGLADPNADHDSQPFASEIASHEARRSDIVCWRICQEPTRPVEW